MLPRFRSLLSHRVSGQSLAVFRICLGLVLAYDAIDFLWPREEIGNYITYQFSPATNAWLFPYAGFEWVHPLPEPWFTGVFVVYGLAAVAMAIGLFTRGASAIVFLAYSYIFLLEASRYNNHYYLAVLITGMMVFAPCARCLSVDRLLRRSSPATNAEETIPYWPIFLLRFQWLMVYAYGAVTKMSIPWLIHAQPIHTWLNEPRIVSIVGRYSPTSFYPEVLAIVRSPQMAYFLSWSGMLFDLLIVPLLLIRRTRLLAVVLCLGFHATNHWLLFDNIGWFPVMAMAGITIFLEPDWPRRVVQWLVRPTVRRPDWGWFTAGLICIPPVGTLLGWKLAPSPQPDQARARPLAWLPFTLICAYAIVQLVVPLRHFFIPGNVDWTAEGARFSWRMKAGQKQATRMEIVIEPPLAADGSAGEFDWDTLGQTPRVYRHVPADQIDYTTMPELFIQFQPFYGERLIYNPFQTTSGSPRTLDEAVSRVKSYWQATYGRQPKVHKTFPLFDVLQAVESRIPAEKLTSEQRRSLVEAKYLATELATGKTDSDTQQTLVAALRERLFELVSSDNELLADLVQRAVAQSHPFATEGARLPNGPLLVVDDPELFLPEAQKGYAVIDRSKWKQTTDPRDTVYANMMWMTQREWPAFPLLVLRVDLDGSERLIWNQFFELRPHQRMTMTARPFMCHQYAQHIADWWEQNTGSRPRVYMHLDAALSPYALQPALDSRVDMATAPLRALSHNDWILPLRSEIY